MTSLMTTIGTFVALAGVLFFLFCAGLVFWYLANQPKGEVSAAAPEPQIQATVEHPTAAVSAPAPAATAPAAYAAQSFAETPAPESSGADV